MAPAEVRQEDSVVIRPPGPDPVDGGSALIGRKDGGRVKGGHVWETVRPQCWEVTGLMEPGGQRRRLQMCVWESSVCKRSFKPQKKKKNPHWG